MSGVLPTTNGLLPTPLATAHNTLDDGSGNATIGGALTAGATVGSHVDALVASGGGQSFHVQPLAGTGSYNPITVNGDVAVVGSGSIEGGAALALAPWSNTRSGLRLLPSGAVLSPANTLDDGAGNATIGGALSVEGAQSGSTLNLSGNATVAGALSVGGAQSGSTLDLSSGATVGGALSVTGAQSGSTLSLSGNATVGGAITSNIVIPGGNSVALTNAISQLSVNVNNFSSPQDAVNYVVSQGGGEILFPASATEYAGFSINAPYNIRIVGQGFGSRISGTINLYNLPDYTTSAATSAADTITLTSVSGLEVGFYLQSYDLPSGNTIPPSKTFPAKSKAKISFSPIWKPSDVA